MSKLRPYLNFPIFLTTSATIGGAGGSATMMNKVSREKDANLVSTFCAGILGGAVGIVGGSLFAFTWPISIAAAGFLTLNKPQPPTKSN